MSFDASSLRTQIMCKLTYRAIWRQPANEHQANARMMIRPTAKTSSNAIKDHEVDIVVFGESNNYTTAVMVGLTPAIEGAESNTPEKALRMLFLATCELLNGYVPKLLSHQRNIHGGGVFDEDVISADIIEAERKSSA